MGQKVNPISLRTPLNRATDSSWYSDRRYGDLALYDGALRTYMQEVYGSARISQGRLVSHMFPKHHLVYALAHRGGDAMSSASSRKRTQTRPQIVCLPPRSPHPLAAFVTAGAPHEQVSRHILAQWEASRRAGRRLDFTSQTFSNNEEGLSTFKNVESRPDAKTIDRSSPLSGLCETSNSLSLLSQSSVKKENAKRSDRPMLDASGMKVQALQNQYSHTPLKSAMEAHASRHSGMTTSFFGIQTRHMFQSADFVAHYVARALEQKKSVRSVWTSSYLFRTSWRC